MKRNLRIGWISAAAYATTGYGIVTADVVSRLIEAGYEVYSIGGIGGAVVWGGKFKFPTERGTKIPILATRSDMAGSDVIGDYINRYKLNLVITFWDFFVMSYCNDLPVPWIAWGPIDAPLTSRMANYVREAFRVVAYSKFGYSQLLRFFPPVRVNYIPHGVDIDIFKPLGENIRMEVREKLHPKPIPEDAFLVVTVGANWGERKMLPFLMLVFKEFLAKHKDAYLYLHTNVCEPFPHGYDLLEFAREIGIIENIRYPIANTIVDPATKQELAVLYSAADVYLSTSIGEGFGMPLLEAQACGVPCIAPDNSSQTELIQGHGWSTKEVDDFVFVPVWIPTLQAYRVPSMSSLLEALEDAYNSPSKREEYAKRSREFSLQYSWDKIIPLWVNLLKEVEEDRAFLNCLKAASYPHLP